jgi:hypothetical protein
VFVVKESVFANDCRSADLGGLENGEKKAKEANNETHERHEKEAKG